MNKSFLVVAAIFVLIGGSIGGAFTGGIILGRSQAENETPAASNLTPPQGFAGQSASLQQFAIQVPRDEQGNPDLAAIRQMAQTQGRGLPAPQGQPTTDSTDTDLEETVSTTNTEVADEDGGDDFTLPGFGGRGLGLIGGGAAFGTIDSIADDIVVINTPQGPVEASIDSDTAIQVFTNGDIADLTEGMSVTVMGQQNAESGRLDAVTIIATPEGARAFPGLGGFQTRPQGGAGRGP